MAAKRIFINELAGDRGVSVKDMDKFVDGLVKSRWDGKNWVSSEPAHCRTCGSVGELDTSGQCGPCAERATLSVYGVGGRT